MSFHSSDVMDQRYPVSLRKCRACRDQPYQVWVPLQRGGLPRLHGFFREYGAASRYYEAQIARWFHGVRIPDPEVEA